MGALRLNCARTESTTMARYSSRTSGGVTSLPLPLSSSIQAQIASNPAKSSLLNVKRWLARPAAI
eukprot:7871575-Lingulodinium_polyedra.AAC.1